MIATRGCGKPGRGRLTRSRAGEATSGHHGDRSPENGSRALVHCKRPLLRYGGCDVSDTLPRCAGRLPPGLSPHPRPTLARCPMIVDGHAYCFPPMGGRTDSLRRRSTSLRAARDGRPPSAGMASRRPCAGDNAMLANPADRTLAGLLQVRSGRGVRTLRLDRGRSARTRAVPPHRTWPISRTRQTCSSRRWTTRGWTGRSFTRTTSWAGSPITSPRASDVIRGGSSPSRILPEWEIERDPEAAMAEVSRARTPSASTATSSS